MIEHIKHAVVDLDGHAHVLLKEAVFQDLLRMAGREETIPHEVVSAMVDGASPLRAWREHLGITQAEVAAVMGISQPAYAQMENSKQPRKTTLKSAAQALGISPALLDV